MSLPLRLDYGFFLLMVAGIIIFTVAASPSSWYLYPPLLVLLGIVLHVTRTSKNRVFYIICSGQPLVIASAAMLVWAGLYIVWMLAGIVLATLGMLGSDRDWQSYTAFCGATLVIAAGIDASNHVLLPLVVIGGLTSLFAVVQTIREYQFRKRYTGANP